jgi:hypothetical protein
MPKSSQWNILLPLAIKKTIKPAIQPNSGTTSFSVRLHVPSCSLSFLFYKNKTSLTFATQVHLDFNLSIE